MKVWDLDCEQGVFLVFKYKLVDNRPFSVVVKFKYGPLIATERRTWNGCGWEIL